MNNCQTNAIWKVRIYIDISREDGGTTNWGLDKHPRTNQRLASIQDCIDAAQHWKTHKNGHNGWFFSATDAWRWTPGRTHIYPGIIDGVRR